MSTTTENHIPMPHDSVPRSDIYRKERNRLEQLFTELSGGFSPDSEVAAYTKLGAKIVPCESFGAICISPAIWADGEAPTDELYVITQITTGRSLPSILLSILQARVFAMLAKGFDWDLHDGAASEETKDKSRLLLSMVERLK